jgi:hypothetical protein
LVFDIRHIGLATTNSKRIFPPGFALGISLLRPPHPLLHLSLLHSVTNHPPSVLAILTILCTVCINVHILQIISPIHRLLHDIVVLVHSYHTK